MNLHMEQLSRHCRVQLTVKTRGVALSEKLLGVIRGSIASAVGRFAERVTRVVVRVDDTNGPRGGVDTECRMTLQLDRGRGLTVSAVAPNEFAAVGRAAARARTCFVRALKKQGSRRRRNLPQPILVEI
jgi:hypothetical protein